MHPNELRETFLSFFEQAGHTRVKSAPLIPRNDPTLFFVNAGMVPFKNYFTGAEPPPYTRACSSQKCLRVSGKHNDLENVGFTARHHTFFEMLGNFSFGDYFKQEAIDYTWTFLTGTLGLPTDRLLVTVHHSDDEAFDLWVKRGVAPERIARCGDKDNFWSMGETGPCGPCTEVFWDLGEPERESGKPDPWGFGHDEDRYVEIWNNVFMQYQRHADGSMDPLPKPSVDTGMGLERLASVLAGANSNYETGIFTPLTRRAAELIGTTIERCSKEALPSLRVIADHARSTAFLIAEGVVPDNEGRGYVLRRIMRRAIRHGVKIGITDNFLHQVAERVIDLMADAYPELKERREFIEKACLAEERLFRRTLDRGLDLIERAAATGTLDGKTVFTLHDTYGFPPDLTKIIGDERKIWVDLEGYETQMEERRRKSREAHKGSGQAAEDSVVLALADEFGPSEFLGYENTLSTGEVLCILKDGVRVKSLYRLERAWVVADRTPFYAESGGQSGDAGTAIFGDTRINILDTQKGGRGHILHQVEVESGTLNIGDIGEWRVDEERRNSIMRNHTATHLLHAALRRHLGEHVTQQGSVVYPDRLRFDFWHMDSLTDEDICIIEDDANAAILADIRTRIDFKSYEQAVADGAMALFGEKYDDTVRVVDVPGVSVELCGGIHCSSTGQIGMVKIIQETGVAANTRRIVAVTGAGVMQHLRRLEGERIEVARLLKSTPEELIVRARKVTEEIKELSKELQQTKMQLLTGGGGDSGDKVREISGVKAHIEHVTDVDPKTLRDYADRSLEKMDGVGIVVLGTEDKGAAKLVIKVSKGLTDKLHAGNIIKEIAGLVGGRGGGRPDMAQAGGKEAAGIPKALDKAIEMIEGAL